MFLNQYLRTPKSIDELHELIMEGGAKWSKEQLELYLLLVPGAKADPSGKWRVRLDKKVNIVLDVLEKAMIGKNMVFIDKSVMPLMPPDLLITSAEIRDIACKSGFYKSPNDRIIRRTHNEGGYL